MPKISVGIVTYNRVHLLKNLVHSILNQDFKDIEIVIGNDYIERPITREDLETNDIRVVIINNQRNLGEIDNLNNVLLNSNGQYFVWQFDDDLFHNKFFINAEKYFVKNPEVKVLYADYKHIFEESCDDYELDSEYIKNYSADEFLSAYLCGKIRVLPYNGIFDKNALNEIGGAIALVPNKIGIYSEYYLLARLSKFQIIGFSNQKLCMSRIHKSSWSRLAGDINLFEEAGLELIGQIINTCNFKDPNKREENLLNLSTSIISTYFLKTIRINLYKSINLTSKYCNIIEITLIKNKIILDSNVNLLNKRINKLLPLLFVKYLVKKIIPLPIISHFYPVRAMLSKITKSPF